MRTSEMSPDFDGNDYKDMIEKAHAIKGEAGNLSITPVYEAYTEIVNLLRADQPAQAREVLRICCWRELSSFGVNRERAANSM